MKKQDLARSQRKVEIRPLRDHPDQALYCDLLLPDVVFADPGLSGGGAYAGGENTDGCGLSGAVGAEQSENFAGLNLKGDAIESDDF
jgi:hypothetical protein